MNNAITKALIYCRVSSLKQVAEGHGLESQEQRCRTYAASKGYAVAEVFHDDGVSGGLFDRPDMQRLIQYLDSHPYEQFAIVFDDLARLARDLQVHLKLKTELVGRGAKLECPNFTFEDSPEGEFIENVLASKAQLDRQQNKRQVVQKMKARLELGYWAFPAPPGLKMVKDPIHGKVLTSKEPYSSIYKQAIEDFRDGILINIEDVKTYVRKRYKEYGITKKFGSTAAKNILIEIAYAGWIEYKPWGVTLRKGYYEGFISLDTFNAVQGRLKGKTHPWKRKDYRADFALRGPTLCNSCGKALTASWSTGNGGKYANYWCKTQGCPFRYKTIAKGKIDGEFEALLDVVKPDDEVLVLANEVLNERWAIKATDFHQSKAVSRHELDRIDQQIKNLASRISKSEDEGLISIYEDEVKRLSKIKQSLEKELNENYYTQHDFGTASNLVFTALKNPLTLWQSDDYSDKRTIILMYFEDALRYDYTKGFGTTSLAYPVQLIQENFTQGSCDVGTDGIEPSTSSLSVKRSTSELRALSGALGLYPPLAELSHAPLNLIILAS